MTKRMLTVMALVLAPACGSNTSSTTATNTSTKTATTTNPDAAVSTPGSAFIPQDIMGVVNTLLAADQATKADPNQTPVEVILKQMDSYFTPMAIGANRITAQIGCPSNSEAPVIPLNDASDDQVNQEKTNLQNAMIQSYATNSSYRAMAVSPMSSDATSAGILNDFVTKRGPVVTLDSDTPSSQRSYYIGTDNVSAGKAAAQELRQVLNAGDAIAVFATTDTTWQSGVDRANGAEAGAQAAGLVVTPRIPTVWNNNTDLAALTTALQDPALNIKGLICCYSNSYLCAAAVDSLGKKGEVQIVGFDFTADSKPWFDKGYYHAIAAQRQYYMGVLGAIVPYSIVVIGTDATAAALQPLLVGPGLINTGLDMVTADAYDDYMAYLTELGVNN